MANPGLPLSDVPKLLLSDLPADMFQGTGLRVPAPCFWGSPLCVKLLQQLQEALGQQLSGWFQSQGLPSGVSGLSYSPLLHPSAIGGDQTKLARRAFPLPTLVAKALHMPRA